MKCNKCNCSHCTFLAITDGGMRQMNKISKMLLFKLDTFQFYSLDNLFRYFRQYKNSLFPNCQIFQVQSGVNIWAIRKVCEAAVVSVSAVVPQIGEVVQSRRRPLLGPSPG